MAVNFSESKTKENLMRAFAGESQARNRYTFAAEQCRREGMQSIGGIFCIRQIRSWHMHGDFTNC